MTPSFGAIIKGMPTLATLLSNDGLFMSWMNRPPMATTQAGNLETISLGEEYQNQETQHEI